METNYSAQDIIDVATVDSARVQQTATAEYAIHQYKDFAEGQDKCFVSWTGQCSKNVLAVVMEVYNVNSGQWEIIAQRPSTYNSLLRTYGSDKTVYGSFAVSTDFELSANIPDLTNYLDPQGVLTCRVYQLDA